MRRFLKATLVLAAALVAAVAFYVAFTLPPRAGRLSFSLPPTVVYGGYHIHTTRSDGSGSVDDIAAAAARAGLGFIVLTDHGDGARAPDPPTYRHGVLCLDAVEVSTLGGHVVAMNLRGPAPYPLAGEAADVIDDIHRLGGWAVAAHPDSPKPQLRWRASNVEYDGIEWLNVDSEWRDNRLRQLVATGLRSLVRPAEAVVSLFERPDRTLQRWDAALVSRPVVALAAVDAHAHGLIGWNDTDGNRGGTLLTRPTYEHLFRALAQAVVLDRPLSGDASSDAARVLAALAGGRSFSIVRGIAGPAALQFGARQAGVDIAMGGRLSGVGSQAVIEASVAQAPRARVVLLHNGRTIAAGEGSAVFSGPVTPGGYRVEVLYPGVAVPWILSNPIHAGEMPARPAAPDGPPGPTIDLPQPGNGWSVEHNATSSGTATAEKDAVRFGFRLGPGPPAGQFAALVSPVAGEHGIDRVQFTARADRPMRVSVQVRLPGGRDGNRWRRSVYLDQTPRTVVVLLREFDSADLTTTLRPFVAPLQSLLFVVDTLNTSPGTEGMIWISAVWLGISR